MYFFGLQEPQFIYSVPRRVLCDSQQIVCDTVMAAYGGSFESASSIDQRKEDKRKARQEVLETVRTESSRNDNSI